MIKNIGEDMRGFLDRLDFDFSGITKDGSLWEVIQDGNSLKIKDVNCGICGYEGEGDGNVPCGYGKVVNCGYKIDFGGKELSQSESWGADSFSGYYKNGVKDGKGIYRFANGTELDGEWENGVIQGVGRYIDADNNLIYEGESMNGKLDGMGIYYYENGYSYMGKWVNGKKNGEGVIVVSEKEKYKRKFRDNIIVNS